jgi:hypothetical protein
VGSCPAKARSSEIAELAGSHRRSWRSCQGSSERLGSVYPAHADHQMPGNSLYLTLFAYSAYPFNPPMSMRSSR